jgi:dienelactone hydrolase
LKGKFVMAVNRQVTIHEGRGGPFESMWVGDAEGDAKPGILLFPNILGTKEWDFGKAEEVAALGYTVLVTDLYGQGKRGISMESGMVLMREISDDRTVMRTRLLDVLATLKESPAVDTSRLGAIGFCFGGQCVLDLARAGADIKGGVSFHGVYDAPPFPNASMTAKLLICHGWNDPLSTPDALMGLAKELTEAGVDWQIQAYGHTGHAFTAENIPLDATKTFGFQPDTYRRSWKAMKDFLAEALS